MCALDSFRIYSEHPVIFISHRASYIASGESLFTEIYAREDYLFCRNFNKRGIFGSLGLGSPL